MSEAEGSDDELMELLRVEATTAQRMAALLRVLAPDSLRAGLGKTPEAYKAWLSGAEPRRDAARALDNLRCTMLTLMDAGKDSRQVERWLTSRLSAHAWPAIELILRAPEAVLAAADAETESRAVAVEILEGATATVAESVNNREVGVEASAARRRP